MSFTLWFLLANLSSYWGKGPLRAVHMVLEQRDRALGICSAIREMSPKRSHKVFLGKSLRMSSISLAYRVRLHISMLKKVIGTSDHRKHFCKAKQSPSTTIWLYTLHSNVLGKACCLCVGPWEDPNLVGRLSCAGLIVSGSFSSSDSNTMS